MKNSARVRLSEPSEHQLSLLRRLQNKIGEIMVTHGPLSLAFDQSHRIHVRSRLKKGGPIRY